MKLNLVYVPSPVLNQTTRSVVKIDKKILQIIVEMKHVLISRRDPEGVGLAAPQVGLPLRIFLIKPYPKSNIRVFINPKLIKTAKTHASRKNALEGCLSIRNTWANISRPKWVELEYQNLDGVTKTERFTGWEAQIIQHELDHLKGVLFTYRAIEQNQELYRIEKNHQGKEELVPIEL